MIEDSLTSAWNVSESKSSVVLLLLTAALRNSSASLATTGTSGAVGDLQDEGDGVGEESHIPLDTSLGRRWETIMGWCYLGFAIVGT
jgi:hypothetical protein